MRKLIMIALMIFIFSSFAIAIPNTADVFSAYNFESGTGSTAVDRTGNGHTGNLTNALWENNAADVKLGTYSLDTRNSGAGMHFDIPAWTPAEDFSVSFWVKKTNTNGAWTWLMTNEGQSEYFMIGMNTAGNVRIRINCGGSDQYSGGGPDASDDEWHLMTAVYNSSNNKGKLFVDGTFAVEVTQSSGGECVKEGGGRGVLSGHLLNLADEPMTGWYDSFIMWEGHALTKGEIAEIYNSGTGIEYPFGAGVATDSMNISSNPEPANLTHFSVSTVAFNLSVNSTLDFNASLFINNVLNETKQFTAGTNVLANWTTGVFPDGGFFYQIKADNGEHKKNSSQVNFTIDTVDPDIVVDSRLNDGSFVALDVINTTFNYFNVNLKTINITLNGVQIFYNGSVEQANFSTNISEDLTDDTAGFHFLFTEACDENNCVNASYNFTKINVTTSFRPSVIEGENNSFTLIVNTSAGNLTQISNVNATLDYNNILYPVEGVFTGDYWLMNTSILAAFITNINDSRLVTWNFTANTQTFSLPQETQTVFQLNLTDCSYGAPTVNYTVKDTGNATLLTSTFDAFFTLKSPLVSYTKTSTINSTATAAHNTCIYPPTGQYTIDAQIEYGASGYATSVYYLTDYAINTTFQEIDLLLSSGTSVVTFTVLDENDNPLEDAFIQVLNYDIGTDTFTTTEILKTAGGFGQAFGNIVLNTEYYKFIITHEGKVVFETTPTILTGTERTFQVNLYGDYYATYNVALGVANTLTFDNTTNTFDFTFSDPSGKMHQACLKLVERSFKANTVINDTCITSTAGTILQTIPGNTTGNIYVATSYLLFDSPFVLLAFTASYKDNFKKFALDGMFVTFLMVLLLGLIGVWNPAVGGLLAFIGLFAAVILGIFQVSSGMLWVIAILAGITIIRLNKN